MPSWRPLTWVIIVVQILFVIWLVGGIGSGVNDADCANQTYSDACEAGTAIGAGMAFIFIVFLWAMIDVILGVIWLVTNKGKRTCPACGNTVKKGLLICPTCNFDFAAAARNGGAPPQGQYPPA